MFRDYDAAGREGVMIGAMTCAPAVDVVPSLCKMRSDAAFIVRCIENAKKSLSTREHEHGRMAGLIRIYRYLKNADPETRLEIVRTVGFSLREIGALIKIYDQRAQNGHRTVAEYIKAHDRYDFLELERARSSRELRLRYESHRRGRRK